MSRSSPCSAPRSGTRSRSSCGPSSPTPSGSFSEDEGVGCIVLTGAGPAFCSGMDVSQFGGDLENRARLVETSTAAFEAVGECERPVIAAVNGPALAGGFALSLLCDLRVAGAEATFGYPELPRGIPPSYAAARAVLPATVAQDLCLTGRVITAQEAVRLSVAREVAEETSSPARSSSPSDRLPSPRCDPRDQTPDPARAQPPLGFPVRRRAPRLPPGPARRRRRKRRRRGRLTPKARAPAGRRGSRAATGFRGGYWPQTGQGVLPDCA